MALTVVFIRAYGKVHSILEGAIDIAILCMHYYNNTTKDHVRVLLFCLVYLYTFCVSFVVGKGEGGFAQGTCCFSPVYNYEVHTCRRQ